MVYLQLFTLLGFGFPPVLLWTNAHFYGSVAAALPLFICSGSLPISPCFANMACLSYFELTSRDKVARVWAHAFKASPKNDLRSLQFRNPVFYEPTLFPQLKKAFKNIYQPLPRKPYKKLAYAKRCLVRPSERHTSNDGTGRTQVQLSFTLVIACVDE